MTEIQLASPRQHLREEGYVVLPDVVPERLVAAAVRRLNLAIRQHGLTPEQIDEWQRVGFFPHLRWEPQVWDVLPPFAAELLGWQEGDEWAEPQLLLRFPDEEQHWDLQPHVDQVPPWAAGRAYRGIVGVSLSDAGPRDGAIAVWPRSHFGETYGPVPMPLAAGDVLVMHPGLGHAGTLNLGPAVRMAIYFRLIARG